jgi:uncharacterized membrane protein YkvA (DUF1232 family)
MEKRKIVAVVLVALGALAYGVSPIDIIPELLTGPLGLIDDAGILAGAAVWIYNIVKSRPATGEAKQ